MWWTLNIPVFVWKCHIVEFPLLSVYHYYHHLWYHLSSFPTFQNIRWLCDSFFRRPYSTIFELFTFEWLIFSPFLQSLGANQKKLCWIWGQMFSDKSCHILLLFWLYVHIMLFVHRFPILHFNSLRSKAPSYNSCFTGWLSVCVESMMTFKIYSVNV